MTLPCVTLRPASRPRQEHLTLVHSLRNYVEFLVAVQLLPALESGEETLVGGQAVLEGVMMRSPHAWAIACRKPSGEVVTMSEPLERPSEKHKWMAWPIVRGVMTLGYAMNLGYRALRFSANVAIEDMMQEDATNHVATARPCATACPSAEAKRGGTVPRQACSPKSTTREKAATLSDWLAAVNIVLSLAFFIFMYKYLPLLAATELKKIDPALGGRIVFNLVDGGIRLACSCSSSGESRSGKTFAASTSITAPSTKPSSPSKTATRSPPQRSRNIRRTIRAAAPAS